MSGKVQDKIYGDLNKWDEFSIEALAVFKGLNAAQDDLLHRGILTKPKMIIDEDYVLDITRMLKVVYNKNLKNFVKYSSGVTLADALADITNRLFLSSEQSRKADSRRTYTVPDYSMYTLEDNFNADSKRTYLPEEQLEKYLNFLNLDIIEQLDEKENKYKSLDTGLVQVGTHKTLYIEKTRLTKAQLIVMGFKKDLDLISDLMDDRLNEAKPAKVKKSATPNLTKIKKQKALKVAKLDYMDSFNEQVITQHKKELYNYLAMVLQNGMVDYVRKIFDEISTSASIAISDSQEDESINEYDKYFMSDDNSQDLIKEVELIQDVKKLAEKAYTISQESEDYDFDYKVEVIQLVLQLSMYSFKPLEISKILETSYSTVMDIRELLKEALFEAAMDSNLGAVTDLESIDKYLEDMKDTISEYKDETVKESSISIPTLQKQLKDVMGRDYYMVQEIRMYLDSQQ